MSIGAPRLRRLGFEVEDPFPDPEQALYALLAAEDPATEDEALLRAIPGLKESLADVQEMIARRLIDPAKARAYFARIEPQLYRFPAIHAPAFRAAVEAAFPDSP